MICKNCGRVVLPEADKTIVICSECSYHKPDNDRILLPGIKDKTPNRLEGFDIDG